MRTRKLLNKALSILLSGTMLAGMIPAVSMTAAAEAYGYHTDDGYVNEWSYSFEKGFDGTQWKSEDKDEDTHGWAVIENKALAHCGGICMRSQSKIIGGESLTPDNWLYSPLIQLPEDKELLLNFYAKGQYNTFGVYIAVGRYNYDNYVQLGSDYTIADTGWQEYTIDLSEYAGKFIHLAFVHHKSSSTQDLFLDCVDISGRPKGYTMTRSWGFEDVEFDGESLSADVPSDFIAADKDKDGDTWEVIKADWHAHSGECSVRARGSADVMDNWLRLPQLGLINNDKDYLLTFYVTDSYAYQTVDVYLYGDKCCDGNVTPEDLDGDGIPEYFSKVLTEEIAIVGKVSGWHEVKVDLSDYTGQYVYAAIVQHGGEGQMCVDDIALWQRDAHTPDGDRTNKYFEGFENEDRKLPEGWETFNKDGDSYNWNAYYGGSEKKHHGKGYVYSESYNGGALTPDNWLVMPSRTISTTKNTTLTFEAVGSHYEDYNEVFGVFISVDGDEFEQIGKDYTTSYVWQEVEVDLTPYAGKSVRVAVVHHNCTDQGRLLLDCFNIWEEPFEAIQSIDITVDRPMVGETVPTTTADYAKLTAASHDITGVSNSCVWYKIKKSDYETLETPTTYLVAEGETFSSDYVYNLYSTFQLNEGYSFADTVKITVNGFDDYFKASEIHYNNSIAVMVTFYPLEEYITDVAVTVTEPVIGAVPDTSPTVVTTPDKTFEHMVAWAKALKEDYTTLTETDWDEIKDPTETFAEGYVYTMAFLMGTHALPQYEFSPDVTATINGKPALSPTESYCYTPSELYAYAVFDLSSTKPQNVKATAGDGQVTLKWDAFPNATSYRIYRADSETGAKSLIKTVGTLYCTDTTVVAGKTYYYFVAAYNSKTGSLSDYSDSVKVTISAKPETPVVTSITTDGSSVKLTWNKVTDATSYRIYRADSATGTKSLIKTVGTLTCTDTTVTAGKTYYYFVAAYNSATGKLSDYSAVKSIKIQAVLGTPTVTSITTDGSSVKLTWNTVTDATSYRIYRADTATGTKKLIKTVGTLYGTDTTVTAGKTYYYFVAAYDSKTARTSDYSAVKSIKVQAVLGTPAVTSITTDGSSVKLTWNKVTDATSYRIYRADTATGTKKLIKTVGTLYGTDTTVTAGKTYYYFVAAYDSKTARTSDYSAVKSIKVQAVLGTPTVTSITTDGSSVKLTWNKVTDATSYRIYRADTATGTKKLIKTVGTLYGTDTTVTAGKTYYYFVAAYDSKTARTSDYSAVKSITVNTPFGAPVIATITTDGSSVKLTWNKVTDATSYRIYRADTATGTKTLIKTVSTLYGTDTTVTAGKTYYYFVAAYDSVNKKLSDYSAAKSITVS